VLTSSIFISHFPVAYLLCGQKRRIDHVSNVVAEVVLLVGGRLRSAPFFLFEQGVDATVSDTEAVPGGDC